MALLSPKLNRWLHSPRAQDWLLVVVAYAIAMMILVGSVEFVKGLFAGLPVPNIPGLPKITTVDGTAITSTTTGQDLFGEMVRRVINVVKLVLQIGVVGYIMWVGTQFIVNLSNEEVLQKKQNQLMYGLLGFVVLNMGDVVIALFTNSRVTGEILDNTRLPAFLQVIDLVLTIIKIGIGIASVLILILTGYKMISAQEKSIEKEKKHILWVAVGLMFVLIAHLIQRAFLAPDMVGFFDGSSEVSFFQNAFDSGTNLVLTIARLIFFMMIPVGFFFLILASVYLLTANGNPDRIKKAKNIYIGTAVAMLMVYSSYAVISEVILNVLPSNITP